MKQKIFWSIFFLIFCAKFSEGLKCNCDRQPDPHMVNVRQRFEHLTLQASQQTRINVQLPTCTWENSCEIEDSNRLSQAGWAPMCAVVKDVNDLLYHHCVYYPKQQSGCQKLDNVVTMCFCTGDYCNSAFKLMDYKPGPTTKAPEDFYTRVFETGPRPAGGPLEPGNTRPTTPSTRNQGGSSYGGESGQQGSSHSSSSNKQNESSSSKKKNGATVVAAALINIIFTLVSCAFLMKV